MCSMVHIGNILSNFRSTGGLNAVWGAVGGKGLGKGTLGSGELGGRGGLKAAGCSTDGGRWGEGVWGGRGGGGGLELGSLSRLGKGRGSSRPGGQGSLRA